MATISIDGSSFKILPQTMSWTYSMKVNVEETYGGRVVQMLMCKADSLSVTGYISESYVDGDDPDALKPGSRSRTGDISVYQWAGMRDFEASVKRIMKKQEETGRPVDFKFPYYGLSFDVWLTGYSNVHYSMGDSAMTYSLTFSIDESSSAIEPASREDMIAALDGIPNGVNWVRTVYNTPTVEYDKVKEAMEKVIDDAGTTSTPKGFLEYLEEVLGAAEESGTGKREQAEERYQKVHEKNIRKLRQKAYQGSKLAAYYLSKVGAR